jgi:flavin-dependent dehydrogenase
MTASSSVSVPRTSEAAYDLLVLGGGPAGAGLAIGAARAGMRVALLERHGYAEAKPGEHIAGSARARLAALGLAPTSALCRFSPGILSFWAADTPAFRSHGGVAGSHGFSTDRAALDAALFDHAARSGVHVFHGETGDFERDGGAWQATIVTAQAPPQRLRAALVADATGRRGTFLRRRGVGRVRAGDLVALVTWLAAPTNQAEYGAPLRIGSAQHGWWSLVDAGGEALSFATYGSTAALRAIGATIHDLPGLLLAEAAPLRGKLQRLGIRRLGAAVYPAFPTRAEAVFGEGWLAIGDAAMAFDPVSGFGVTNALEMAERALDLVLADPGLARLGPLYAEALEKRFREHLERRREAYSGSRIAAEALSGLLGHEAMTTG